MDRSISIVGLAALAILAGGCGAAAAVEKAETEARKAAEEARRAAELQKARSRTDGAALAQAQLAHALKHKRGAHDAAELEKFLPEWVAEKPEKKALADAANDALPVLKRGDWVLVWDATAPQDFMTAIVAHEKDAPTKGGFVANGLGEVTAVTAAEFAKLTKFPIKATDAAAPKDAAKSGSK